MKTENAEIYISYAWGDETSSLVDSLMDYFVRREVTIIREAGTLNYKGSIHEYMKDATKRKAMVVVITDRYLKSTHCMFELSEIIRTDEYFNRVIPLILSDADIHSISGRLGYIEYWNDKLEKIEESVRAADVTEINNAFLYELNVCTRIKHVVGDILSILSDMSAVFVKEDLKSIELQKLAERIDGRIKIGGTQ